MKADAAGVRWGDGRRADSDFARDQILDAAWRCYQQLSVQKTRMEHIAREAKVSRTTVYRYFQSRDEVLTGVVLRALQDMIDLVQQRAEATASFAEFLIETVASSIEQLPRSPVFAVLMKEAMAVMNRLYVNSNSITEIAVAYYQPRFEVARAGGELRDGVELEGLIEWVTHVCAAFVLVPSTLYDLEGLRRLLWTFFTPAIIHPNALPSDKLT